MSICMNCGQRHGGGISCLDLALHQVAALTAQRDRLAGLVQRLVDDAEIDGAWSDAFDSTFRKLEAAMAELERKP